MSTTAQSKGKQKTKGQKQIFDENIATMKFYAIMATVGVVFYFTVSYVLFYSSTSNRSWGCFVFSLLSQIGSLYCMKFMGKAIRGENGQLIDAGLDLNMKDGFAEYCKDAVILLTAVQILAVISSYFWLLILLIPSYAILKLWTSVLAPWFFAPAPEGDENDPAALDKKKRREKRIIYKR